MNELFVGGIGVSRLVDGHRRTRPGRLGRPAPGGGATGPRGRGRGGRLLLRESGTEPVIRVMAEGEDEALVRRLVNQLCSLIEEAASGKAA